MLGIGYGMGVFVHQVQRVLPAQSSSGASAPVPPGTEYASVRELGEQMARPVGSLRRIWSVTCRSAFISSTPN